MKVERNRIKWRNLCFRMCQRRLYDRWKEFNTYYKNAMPGY